MHDNLRDENRTTGVGTPTPVEESRATFRCVEDVTSRRGNGPLRFSVKVLRSRRKIEGRIAQLRDAMRPMRSEEADLKAELNRIDATLVEAWRAGARTSDNSLVVDDKAVAHRWSKEHVSRVVATLGITYEQAVEIADFGTKSTVKTYR